MQQQLAGIAEYFGHLGVKMGHRKVFKDLAIEHAPGMDARGDREGSSMAALRVASDQQSRRSASKMSFIAPLRRKDSVVTFAYSSVVMDGRKRFQGEVVLFATKQGLYDAGYAPRD